MYEGYERYKYWLNPYNLTGKPVYDVILDNGLTFPVTKVNQVKPVSVTKLDFFDGWFGVFAFGVIKSHFLIPSKL